MAQDRPLHDDPPSLAPQLPSSTSAGAPASAPAPAPSRNAASPSPPPPTAPTALTPGPRAEAFIKLYSDALRATLSAVSYDSFAACFPGIAAQAPAVLRGYHGQIVGRLEGLCMEDFQTILQERSVVSNLNKLEDLVTDARRRKALSTTTTVTTSQAAQQSSAPPPAAHLLPPQPLLSLHLTPLYISQQSQLNAKLQTTQSQNANLMEEVRGQRGEIERLLGLAEGWMEDLEGAGMGGGREGAGDAEGVRLADEAREAERVLLGMER